MCDYDEEYICPCCGEVNPAGEIFCICCGCPLGDIDG